MAGNFESQEERFFLFFSCKEGFYALIRKARKCFCFVFNV